ncbi:Putative ribosomal N-acetyltransferase YdaF [Bacillus sp. THAF10]|uniref:GNAT family N-acetyltransferase n=1 Tax=Bacillus sp. THAF10 TaxID=2587848 RepID=UPI001268CE45|nr:GNAT family protein [Bacillus sp. THAF10]QFT87522.1 Putative ribosomal N-acetyltransferase YdaF [Bacillus sp. THAF10]
MFVHKIDEELALKLAEVKDAERLYELTDNSREYLREWLPWVDFTKSADDTRNFIKMTRQSYADNKALTAMILYKGEIVGSAGFNTLDWSNKVANIGYWLDKDYQGKGIMTRVAGALTDYAITELGMNRVDIRAAEKNVKSRSIPERLGFTLEGKIRQAEWLYDHHVDHMVYGMLAEEWKKKSQ